MRARYYSPAMRRFVNADIIPGTLSNAVTLNRYAYANGNPVSNVDPFGLSAERRIEGNSEKIDRAQYIDSYMENTDNELYRLLQTWGISLTQNVSQSCDYINMLWGGIVVKIYVDVLYSTPFEANGTSEISIDSGDMFHEVKTPEMLLTDDLGVATGIYIDEGRSSVGVVSYIRDENTTYSIRQQTGLYSDAQILSIVYTPEDERLPAVRISLDCEVNHLVKLAAAGAVAVACCVPEAVVAIAPSIAEFIQQLGTMTPSFG